MPRTAVVVALAWALATSAGAQIIEVERQLGYSTGCPSCSIHTVTLPAPDFVPDIANSAADDPGDPDELPPDGVVNADDLICLLWAPGREGIFSIARRQSGSCTWTMRTAFRSARNPELIFIGAAFDYDPGVGYVVYRGKFPWEPDLSNRVTLRSRCNLHLEARELIEGCDKQLLVLPYDTPYRHADEVLCGLEGTDYLPTAEGEPDACPNGVFDPETGRDTHLTSATGYDPRGYAGRSVFGPGRPHFVGTNFALEPSHSPRLITNDGHGERTWAPHGGDCVFRAPELDPLLARGDGGSD